MYIHADMIGSKENVPPRYINKSKLCPMEMVAKSPDFVMSGLKCRTVYNVFHVQYFEISIWVHTLCHSWNCNYPYCYWTLCPLWGIFLYKNLVQFHLFSETARIQETTWNQAHNKIDNVYFITGTIVRDVICSWFSSYCKYYFAG